MNYKKYKSNKSRETKGNLTEREINYEIYDKNEL